MRLIKMLGLAAIVASALMSTVGTSSAFATQLENVVWCKKRVNECPEILPEGITFHAISTNTKFLSNIGNIECKSSELLLANPGLLVHGEVSGLTFANCTREGSEACVITAENLPYLYKGELRPSNLLYEVLVSEIQLYIHCAFPNCRYEAPEGLIAALLEQPTEELNVLETLVRVKGFFCVEVEWHSEYSGVCQEPGKTDREACWIKMEPY